MRIAELTPSRLVIEDGGSGFGVVCLLAGHGLAGLAIARPPFHLWLQVLEFALGATIAVYGALALTKTRTELDRVRGEVRQERRNLFRADFSSAYFYEVEEVFLQRGSREADAFSAEPDQAGAFRPAIRVRGRALPLARAYRDHRTAAAIARAVRGVLDDFAAEPTIEPEAR